MSRDKQIEEMAKSLCKYSLTEYCASGRCENPNCLVNAKALEVLYEKGYRKASEIAREIFEEIEKEIKAAIESNYRAKKERYKHSVIPNYDSFTAMCDGKICAMRGLLDFIAELKKKYTEGGE